MYIRLVKPESSINLMKTVPTTKSVSKFLDTVQNKKRKEDALKMVAIMQEITGAPPVLWGASIVGFGTYHYKYESGREGDFMCTGFSPRKTALTLYIMSGFERHADLMQKLGTYKTGKSCLYIKNLDEIDIPTLKQLILESVKYIQKKYA